MGLHVNNNANNINNLNNNINLNIERNQQQRNMTNEELLEHIDLSQITTNITSSNKNSDINFDDINTEDNKLLKKFLRFKKFQEKINGLKERIGQDIKPSKQNCESGAISYGLPTEAVYNRKIENEIKRLEIELINQKFLKIYEDPKNALMNFNEENNIK